MYTKITTSGGRRYLQLVEGYRNEDGKVRHRVIATLGRIEDLTPRKLDPRTSTAGSPKLARPRGLALENQRVDRSEMCHFRKFCCGTLLAHQSLLEVP